MLSTHQLAATDKEGLNDCVLPLHSQGDNILVAVVASAGDLLLFHAGLKARQKVPILSGLFKLHGLGSLLHFLLDIRHNRLVVAV